MAVCTGCYKDKLDADFYFSKTYQRRQTACKGCAAKTNKANYQQKRLKNLENKKVYYDANSERIRAYKKAHYQKHKEEYKKRKEKRYREHKNEILTSIRNRKYAAKSPERQKATDLRRWVKALPPDSRFLWTKYLHWSTLAKSRNLDYTIVYDDVWELWTKQNGICYLSDMPMVLAYGSRQTVSMDRVDSNGHYTADNVALCCELVNKMKLDLSVEEMKIWCSRIVGVK